MAIDRPVTKTIISTVAWGIPITDEVNRLTAWQQANAKVAWGHVASAKVTASQNGIGTAPTLLTGLQITFTVMPNRLYQVVIGGLTLYAANGGVVDLYLQDSLGNTLMKVNGAVTTAGFVPWPLLMTPPYDFGDGPLTLRALLSISSGSVNTSQSSNNPAFIQANDIGPVS